MKIETALISVSDKANITEFAKALTNLGLKTILSTGGTANLLADNNLPVTEVSNYTGFPEMMDGRVKTLHPKVHGGILALRDNSEHMDKAKEHNITMIDMVVVNLYPFQATISKPDCTLEDAIENIDIGGPTMIRAAAKNFKHVVVIIDPNDYEKVLDELKDTGDVSYNTRLYLAYKVFKTMSEYDEAIYNYLNGFIKK